MVKTFKKAIAIAMTLVFILSLVPFSAMAEVADENEVSKFMKFQNWATTRNKGTDTPGPYTSSDIKGHYAVQLRNDSSSNDRRSYAQLDFTGYEEILGNENTNILIRVTSGSSSSTYSIKNFNLYAMNDTTDFYATEYDSAAEAKYEGDTGIRMTFANAKNAGLHSYDEKGVLLHAKSDGKSTVDYPFYVNPEDIELMLNTGKDNSIVTFSFKSTDTTTTQSKTAYLCHTMETFGTTITYDKSKIDNKAYVDSAAEKLTWEELSEEEIDSAANDLILPAKWYGADVKWSSSDKKTISDDGKITPNGPSKNVILTATLSYKGIDENAQLGVATKEFEITVKPEEIVTTEIIPFISPCHTRNDGTERFLNKFEADIAGGYGVRYIYLSKTAYVGYAQFDLSKYTEILNAPSTKTEFTVVAGNGYTSYLYDFKVSLASDKADMYIYKNKKLSRNKAIELGIHEDIKGEVAEGSPVLFERTEKTRVDNKTVISGAANTAALAKVLNESSTNGLVTMVFTSSSSSNGAIRTNSEISGLKISYYPSELDSESYYKDIEESFSWDAITSDAQNLLVNNLTNYYKGANIVWSSGEGAIASSGELIPTKGEFVEDTLTANILYKDYSSTRKFDVRICDGKIVATASSLDFENGKATANVSATNGKADKATLQLYIATYLDEELTSLTPVTLEVEKGTKDTKEFSVDNIASESKVKLFVWESDNKTPAFAAIEK